MKGISVADQASIPVGLTPLRVLDVVRAARGDVNLHVDPSPVLSARVESSVRFIHESLARNDTLYGVNTGYGASAAFAIPPALVEALPLNLLRYHGCGTGRPLGELEAAAVVVARLASVGRGYSGLRREVLDRLCELLGNRLLPVIPEEGSVGASGDLTPLSYLAALLVGEREAYFRGARCSAAEAHRELGLEPLVLRPKEALAIMNGTSMMTGLACLAWERAARLGVFCAALSAMTSDVLLGLPGHYDDRIFELKPHPGSRIVARWMREGIAPRAGATRVQDRYSLRCAPHVIGVLLDALPGFGLTLERELNGVNDNPIVDPDAPAGPRALHGGNFYGGHVCFVTDGLKNLVANLGDLLERQLVLLNNPATSEGLPANLVAQKGEERFVHHGFKAMEITASALVAEALKLTMPASAFSRSTESHNQDKVSMGAISARECLRIIELVERVSAIHLLALAQAVDLRGPERCHRRSRALRDAVRARVPRNDADRRMDVDIASMLAAYREQRIPLPDVEGPLEGLLGVDAPTSATGGATR